MDVQEVARTAHENLDYNGKLALMEDLLNHMVMSGQIGEPGSASDREASRVFAAIEALKDRDNVTLTPAKPTVFTPQNDVQANVNVALGVPVRHFAGRPHDANNMHEGRTYDCFECMAKRGQQVRVRDDAHFDRGY